MDCRLSRREMLRFLTVVLPTALLGFKVIDYFDEELVCVHVCDLSQNLPDPLLERNEKSQKGSLAVILTLNDYTRNACHRLVNICCEKGVDEMVIFKDPSKPPYLCSYPSPQKGFKKKPPIGDDSKMRSFA